MSTRANPKAGGDNKNKSGAKPAVPLRTEAEHVQLHKSLFERFNIDPLQGPRAITERLRELAEEASDTERDEIRAAWEELTLHPMRRLRAAFASHPESRPPLGNPPPPPREPPPVDRDLTLGELAVRPSVARALSASSASSGSEASEKRARPMTPSPGPVNTRASKNPPPCIGIGAPPSLEDDPILKKDT